MSEPSLYGIENSNRTGGDLWGKNQFNSTFPVALCCYMRDHGIKPVYVSLDANSSVCARDDNISINHIFGTGLRGSEVRFEFEVPFLPFEQDFVGGVDKTDLVTMTQAGDYLRAIEIKLTVLPDNSTANRDEREWGSELVVRPVTSAYATARLWSEVVKHGATGRVRRIVESVASSIQTWDNIVEIQARLPELVNALDGAVTACLEFQNPFVMQPIWKTLGKSPLLAEQCFDVFVWSDLAIWKILVDASKTNRDSITRTQRECARTVRALYELATTGNVQYDRIYRGMALGNQTDKACAFSGRQTHRYMEHSRLADPALPKSVLSSIILGGGESMLSPERRFDASVYFARQAQLARDGN